MKKNIEYICLTNSQPHLVFSRVFSIREWFILSISEYVLTEHLPVLGTILDAKVRAVYKTASFSSSFYIQ